MLQLLVLAFVLCGGLLVFSGSKFMQLYDMREDAYNNSQVAVRHDDQVITWLVATVVLSIAVVVVGAILAVQSVLWVHDLVTGLSTVFLAAA